MASAEGKHSHGHELVRSTVARAPGGDQATSRFHKTYEVRKKLNSEWRNVRFTRRKDQFVKACQRSKRLMKSRKFRKTLHIRKKWFLGKEKLIVAKKKHQFFKNWKMSTSPKKSLDNPYRTLKRRLNDHLFQQVFQMFLMFFISQSFVAFLTSIVF